MKARGKIAGVIIIVALCVTGGLSFMFWQQGPGNFVAGSSFHFDGHVNGTDFAIIAPSVVSCDGSATAIAANNLAYLSGNGRVTVRFPASASLLTNASVEITFIAGATGESAYLYDVNAQNICYFQVTTGCKVNIGTTGGGRYELATVSPGDRVTCLFAPTNSTHFSASIRGRTVAFRTQYGAAQTMLAMLRFNVFASPVVTWNLISIKTSWDAKFPVI